MLANARSTNAIAAAVFGTSCCLLILANSAWGQVRQLQTRDATRLSEVQVIDQLNRSDVVLHPCWLGGNKRYHAERS